MNRIDKIALRKRYKFNALWAIGLGSLALYLGWPDRPVWMLLAGMDFLIAAFWTHLLIKLTEKSNDSSFQDRED